MNSRFSSRLLVLAGIAGWALFCGGCATASKSSAMIAAPEAPVTKHAGSVSVAVSGGADTSSLGASNIANADFAEAIKASITQSGLFAKLAGGADPADYQLEVNIVRLDRPTFGLSFTVNLETTWRLLHRGDAKPVWEKAITSTFTAKVGDAFAGVTRLRLANEGAARANIKDAIAQIGALTLP
jgi:hypothetical protein